MLRIHVNTSTCIGCGLCVSLAPQTFVLGDSGKAQVLSDSQDSEEAVKNAVESCPVNAIRVEE